MKKTQKKQIEVQGYFDGHAPPMPPKKRSLPAEPATSPKPAHGVSNMMLLTDLGSDVCGDVEGSVGGHIFGGVGLRCHLCNWPLG